MILGRCARSVKGVKKTLDEKLKRVVELTKQLQTAVRECASVITATVKSDIIGSPSDIHVSNLEGLDGLTFYHQGDDGSRWFYTDYYGIRIVGAVKGGNQS